MDNSYNSVVDVVLKFGLVNFKVCSVDEISKLNVSKTPEILSWISYERLICF